MLDALRRSMGSWVTKIFLGVLMFSFAVWGVSDIFTGYRGDALATVGETEIHGEVFRNELQGEMQLVGRRIGRPLTLDEARALGIDAQVLGRMITEAALNEKARELGLGMSDAAIADSIRTDPSFLTPGGIFDRAYFEQVLRATGMSEAGFVADRRLEMLRQVIGNATTSGIAPSDAMQEAVHAYGAETRSMDYFVIGNDSLEPVGDPDDTTLTAYFEANKARFTAPEYRAIAVLNVDPQIIGSAIEVSEQEARERYEQDKARYEVPERRSVQQIVFAEAVEAQAALEQIRAGASFEDIAEARGLSPEETLLGSVARADILDPAVAEAAFALEEGAVSDVIAGQFGNVLVSVTAIEAGSESAFEDVRDALVADIQRRRGEDRVLDLYDEIEDARAAGETLPEIATAKGLTLQIFPAVDARGNDPEGAPVTAMPARDSILREAFQSDVGIENDPLQLRGSVFIWYDVQGIEPARERTLDEVRDDVVAAWRAGQIDGALDRTAAEAVDSLKSGDSITVVASRFDRSVTSVGAITRAETSGPVGAVAVQRLFLLRQGEAAFAEADNAENRVIFVMTGAATPPHDAADDATLATYDRLALGQSNDLLGQYVAALRDTYGVNVNPQLLSEILGAAPRQDR